LRDPKLPKKSRRFEAGTRPETEDGIYIIKNNSKKMKKSKKCWTILEKKMECSAGIF
jgi:hypothetical protein